MKQFLLFILSISSLFWGCDNEHQGEGGFPTKKFQATSEPQPTEANNNDESIENENGGGGISEEDAEVGEDVDGGIDEDDGEAKEDRQIPITINLLRVDFTHRNVALKVKKLDGSWHDFNGADKGKVITVEDVCYADEECKVVIAAINDDSVEVQGDNKACFIGLETSSKKLGVGFEKYCDGSDYHNIDDIIFEIEAAKAESVTVEGINKTGSSCNLNDWVADDGCGGFGS